MMNIRIRLLLFLAVLFLPSPVHAGIEQTSGPAPGPAKAPDATAVQPSPNDRNAEARRLLARAAETAGQITDARMRSGALRTIAVLQAKAGDASSAAKIAEELKDPSDGVAVLLEIAFAHTDAGDNTAALGVLERVRPLVPRVEDDDEKAVSEAAVAVAQAHSGDTEGALKAIAGLNPYVQMVAFQGLLNMQLAHHDVTAATETATHIRKWTGDNWSIYAVAMLRIADSQHAAGDRDGARKTVESARQGVAKAIADSARSEGMMPFAEWQEFGSSVGKRGDVEFAAAAFAQARALIPAGKEAGPLLSELAGAQAETGLYSDALKTAGAVPDDAERASVLARIATAQASQDRAAAKATIREALATAARVKNASRQAILGEIAVAQMRAGNREDANRRLQSVVKAARKQTGQDQYMALFSAALDQARAGDVSGALETANAVKEPWRRIDILQGMAVTLGKNGDRAGALQVCRAAIPVALKSGEMADTALEQFARVQMDVGDYEGAAATAAKMPGSESGRYTRAMVLRWVSLDQSRAGDPQEALARAERLSDPYNRVSALSGVAAGLLGIRRNDLPD